MACFTKHAGKVSGSEFNIVPALEGLFGCFKEK
jgi:hypothetical protein